MANKQIYEFGNKPILGDTDLSIWSDESAAHLPKNQTFAQLKNQLNDQLQLADTAQVTGLGFGEWNPSYTLGAGIISATTLLGLFVRIGQIVICLLNFNVELAADLVNLGVTLPIAPDFTADNQAMGGALSFVDSAAMNLADGQINRIVSDEIAQKLDVEINAAVGAGNKIICMLAAYQIQV